MKRYSKDKVKEWVISQVAGPLGLVIRPVIASILGILIAFLYEQAWTLIKYVDWLYSFSQRVVDGLPQGVIAMLTPQAIGATAAIILWLLVSDWIIYKLKGGIKQIQTTYNDSVVPGTVIVDGLAVKDGETSTAISRLAAKAVVPVDRFAGLPRGVVDVSKKKVV